MANTYKLIEAKTLGSNTATISFTSIPSTYTDLKLTVCARNTKNATTFLGGIKFNGSSSNFTFKSFENATSQGGSGSVILWANGPTSTSSTFANVDVYIPNYASSSYKSFSIDGVAEDNSSGGALLQLYAGLWSNTSAITSIDIYDAFYGASDFVPNSTFYLYGISSS